MMNVRCAIGLAGCGALLAALAPLPALAQPVSRHAGVHPADTGYVTNRLTGVKALATDDVWVVGSRLSAKKKFQPITRHFDGDAWRSIGRLEPLPHQQCSPTSVDATADDDVWVTCRGAVLTRPQIEHWDGAAWHVQDTADLGDIVGLNAVWAHAPDDVFAVGEIRLPGGRGRSLVEHFDGHIWTQIPVPRRYNSELLSVSGTSANDVWAVGSWGATQTLTLHYNGLRWSVIDNNDYTGGSILASVVALSPNDVWAVGHTSEAASGLVLHWDGDTWEDVQSDAIDHAFLNGVSAVEAQHVMVVGLLPDGSRNLAMAAQWDGQSWQALPPRQPGGLNLELLSVSAAGPSDVWAVGHRMGSNGTWLRMCQHWDGVRWQRLACH